MRIAIGQISTDGGTQPRVALNESVVADYAEALRSGAELPPITLFFDGAAHWLADGFHRFHAHRQIGADEIEANVRTGTRRDAILHSVGANDTHGLRRSNDDKRKAVLTLLRDAEWQRWSDREIARCCAVDHKTVAKVRSDVTAEIRSEKPIVTGEIPSEESDLTEEFINGGAVKRTYTDKHGNESVMNTANIGRKVESEDEQTPTGAEPSNVIPLHKPEPAKPDVPASEADALRAEIEELRDRLAEMADQFEETLADNQSMAKVLDASDQVAAALAEAKKYRDLNRILEERIRGLNNEKAEAVRMAKSWQRKAQKAGAA